MSTKAKRALFKAAMYESKLSGLRGKAAREALLEAEHAEKRAAEALQADVSEEGLSTCSNDRSVSASILT